MTSDRHEPETFHGEPPHLDDQTPTDYTSARPRSEWTAEDWTLWADVSRDRSRDEADEDAREAEAMHGDA